MPVLFNRPLKPFALSANDCDIPFRDFDNHDDGGDDDDDDDGDAGDDDDGDDGDDDDDDDVGDDDDDDDGDDEQRLHRNPCENKPCCGSYRWFFYYRRPRTTLAPELV